jgi:hypothetical protein
VNCGVALEDRSGLCDHLLLSSSEHLAAIPPCPERPRRRARSGTDVAHAGDLFAPNPMSSVGCLDQLAPDLRSIVRQRPLAVIAADVDGYSVVSSALEPTASLSDHLGLVRYQSSYSSVMRSPATADRWRPSDSGRSGTHLARHRADPLSRLERTDHMHAISGKAVGDRRPPRHAQGPARSVPGGVWPRVRRATESRVRCQGCILRTAVVADDTHGAAGLLDGRCIPDRRGNKLGRFPWRRLGQ